MKNRTLTLLAACLMGGSAFAQSWTAPTLPEVTASTLQDGHYYQVMLDPSGNTDISLDGLFLTAGSSWFSSWATSCVINERDYAITYLLESSEETDDDGETYTVWTFWDYDNYGSIAQGYIFISYNELSDDEHTSAGAMHTDNATDENRFFEISQNANPTGSYSPTYRFTVARNNTNSSAEGKSGTTFVGIMSTDETYDITDVYAFLDPDGEGNCVDWVFVDVTLYEAQLALYNELEEAYNSYSKIVAQEISDAATVYNDASSTAEQLLEQVDKLKEAILANIFNNASMDDPNDVTLLIENNDFSTGDISGWTCTFVSGENATNIGYQSSSYTNDSYTYTNHEGEDVNPYVNQFIEAWSASTAYGSTDVSRSIGDGYLSQTIEDAPAGNYMLSCDAIAVNQDNTSLKVTGVQLFATDTANDDFYTEIATGDGLPEHVSVYFYTAGGELTFGLRTNNTDANWIGADNFELLYYGNDVSIQYVELMSAISTAKETFSIDSADDLDVIANADLKDDFTNAFATAESLFEAGTDDDAMGAAATALNAATSALSTSVEEYASVAAYIEYILSVETQASDKGWSELAEDLSTYRADTLEDGYDAGTLTSDDIAEMEDIVSNMIADYISENCQENDDISLIINNNDFDTDFSGWTVVSGATPAWGGSTSLQNENVIEGGTRVADIGSGCAEVYWAAFDICQTLKNLPEGKYTLSCQAFERNDVSGDVVQTVLYADIDGNEQSQTIMDLLDEGSPEPLYLDAEDIADASWYCDVEATLTDGSTGYVPNGMNGADIYFYNDYYYNSFDFVVTHKGDVTIGIRNTNATDWVLFDTFRLVYKGNSADVYTDRLNELIDEAQAVQDGGITLDADAMLSDAIEQGEEALDSNDADVRIAAIDALEEAIDYAQSTADAVSELEEWYAYTSEIRMESGNIDDSTDEYYTISELLNTVYSALYEDGVPSVEKAEQWIMDMKTEYNKMIMAGSDVQNASEDEPADVSDVIINPDYIDIDGVTMSDFGWTENGTIGVNYNAAEIYDQSKDASLSQTLYNLIAGYYRLHVQGFYRPGMAAQTVDIADCDSLIAINGADIYAGENATRLTNILTDGPEFSEIKEGTTETTYYLPYSMEEAGDAFDNDLYQNTLQFQVAEDGTDVEIGIVKTGHVTYDWTIFGRWTLEYLGTTEPTEDTTTAIAQVEGADAPVAVAIFTVDGKQTSKLTKGINIVKKTMADGSVKVSKVLVK